MNELWRGEPAEDDSQEEGDSSGWCSLRHPATMFPPHWDDGASAKDTGDVWDSSPASPENLCGSDDIVFEADSQPRTWDDEDSVADEDLHPRRGAYMRAAGMNTSYFAHGGALDSQTSETQFVLGLLDDSQDLVKAAITNTNELHATSVSTLKSTATIANPGTPVAHGQLEANTLAIICPKDGGEHTQNCQCDTCFVKLKQANTQLREQLEAVQRRYYEYCGRWTLASQRVRQLEDQLTSAGLTISGDDLCGARVTLDGGDTDVALAGNISMKRKRGP